MLAEACGINAILIPNHMIVKNDNVVINGTSPISKLEPNSQINSTTEKANLDKKLKTRSTLLAQVEASLVSLNIIVCDKCKDKLDSPTKYFDHVNQFHRSSHTCDHCSQVFEKKENLLEHWKEHKKTYHFCCPHCEKGFSEALLLEAHLCKNHQKPKRLQCPLCQSSFVRIHDVKKHLDVHLEIRQHVCHHCGKEFSHQSNLARHERLHTGDKPYVCQICGKRFAQSFSLRTHMWLHNDAVSCEHCPSKFRSISGLTRHYRNAHNIKLSNTQAESLHQPGERKTSFFFCRYCGDRFMRKRQLNNHIAVCHSDQEPYENVKETHGKTETEPMESNVESPANEVVGISLGETSSSFYEEPLVLKIDESKSHLYVPESGFFGELSEMENQRFFVISTDSSLESATEVQEGSHAFESPPVEKKTSKKIYVCDVCGKKTNKKWNHEVHMTSHDPSLKKYQCQLCNWRFLTLRSLNRHLMTHTNIDVSPYGCQQCDKSYKTSESLAAHVRKKHENRINHICTVCNKGFYASTEYAYHMRVHSKEMPYMCSSCGKKFSHSSHLYRHEKIHSGIKPHKCLVRDECFHCMEPVFISWQ